MGMLDAIFATKDFIVNAVRAIWKFIKHIFHKVLQFFAHIVSFFKELNRLRKLQQNKDIIAAVVKDNLDSGNFNTTSCLFNKATGEVVDMEEDAQGIEAEELDADTQRNFGDKAMIVLT